MKKLCVIFLFSLMAVCMFFPLLTLAEEVGIIDTNITDYLKPEEFASLAGQVAFVVAMAQFLKLPLDKVFGHIKTCYVVYFLAACGQVLARLLVPALGVLCWAAVTTMILQATAVAWAAMKAYEQLIARVEEKKAALLKAQAVEVPPNVE
jgi:hypothetical protein